MRALRVPGDKSISHRYAMLAGIADGVSRLHGYAPGADCAATLAPLIKAEQELSDDERHLLMCFARRDADVIDIHQAAEMSGGDPGAIEMVLESLADVHLIEPLVLGRYRLPQFVRIYFGLRTPMLTS